ncbi:hypothetical protein BD779DRAFT_1607356 [Infundibulicybe gibba]|nr:hypothetical protein BD779DRAFT_1607356 [Infundibulicybe gibba]
MAHYQNLARFSGEAGDSTQPDDFLKDFNNALAWSNITTDTGRVDLFQNSLKSRSEAEDWLCEYRELVADTKINWNEVQRAFLRRFPPIERSKKTKAEYERELGELKLTTAELGKRITYAGEEVWAHVAFAHKLLNLAHKAGVAKTGVGVWAVRDSLPNIIKKEVDEEQENWTTFCEAIKKVPVYRIRDGIAQHEEQEKARAKIDQLESQISRMRISNSNSRNPTPPAATQATGNPAGAQRPRPQLTDEERAMIRRRAAAYPLQPDTVEGRTTWEEQKRAWRAEFGENERVSPRTGFPLRPGGAPLFSGECYQCGKTGHRRQDCTATGEELLKAKERDWRRIAGTAVGHRGASRINFVGGDAVDEFAWENTVGTSGSQGNGEGPSA